MPDNNTTTFEMTLFDDASTKEKLTVMDAVEAMFDDERNEVPDDYFRLMNVPLGGTVRITVEGVKNGTQ